LESRSRWFVGSSSSRRLLGFRSILARASRFLSPPERTATFLFTSSPEKRKPPRIVRIIGTMVDGLEDDISS
jgi:hypothetical protein